MKVNDIDFSLVRHNLAKIMFSVYQWRDNNNRQGKKMYNMLADTDWHIYNQT